MRLRSSVTRVVRGQGAERVIGFSTRAPFQVSRRKADILSLKVKNFLSLKVAAFLGRQSFGLYSVPFGDVKHSLRKDVRILRCGKATGNLI